MCRSCIVYRANFSEYESSNNEIHAFVRLRFELKRWREKKKRYSLFYEVRNAIFNCRGIARCAVGNNNAFTTTATRRYTDNNYYVLCVNIRNILLNNEQRLIIVIDVIRI